MKRRMRSIDAFVEFLRPEDVRPKFTVVSRRSGIPVSALSEQWRKLVDSGDVRITVEFKKVGVVERWVRPELMSE